MELTNEVSKIVNQVIKNFKIEGCFASVQRISEGLINDTYKITTPDLNAPDYILQKINNKIFPDIQSLTYNKILISNALKSKIKAIEFIQTMGGKYFHTDSSGESWHASIFIPNSKTIAKPIDVNIAYEVGKTIGLFHKHTTDINPKELNITIPNFHNLSSRLTGFKRTVEVDIRKRVGNVKEYIEQILKEASKLMFIDELTSNKDIPERVCHYDTKLSNILFNCSNEAICLIDYDTIMPGTWLFDFGDAVRSICNSCEEDEKDLSKVLFKLNLYKSLEKGYLSNIQDVITKEEQINLTLGAKYIILEQALRFLKDYLDGDVYYKINYPEHNLLRAKVQLKLYNSLAEEM